jgi:hypothetical protein
VTVACGEFVERKVISPACSRRKLVLEPVVGVVLESVGHRIAYGAGTVRKVARRPPFFSNRISGRSRSAENGGDRATFAYGFAKDCWDDVGPNGD